MCKIISLPKKTYAYDYYTVVVPSFIGDTLEEIERHAILIAEERAKLWCMPSDWSAMLVDGSPMKGEECIVKVRRVRWKGAVLAA